MRMFQSRQNLSLAQEACLHRFAVHPAFDHFQCGALFELTVRSLGEPHHTHAAAAEFLNQAPRADAVAGAHGLGIVVLRPIRHHASARRTHAAREPVRHVISSKQCCYVTAQLRIVAA